MANTEGLGDDAFENMLGRSALERRMEMPMGDRPAARVTRPSGRRLDASTPVQQQQQPHEEETKQQQQETTKTNIEPVMMGNVVEQKTRRRRRKKEEVTGDPNSTGPVAGNTASATDSTKKPSRFAQQASSSAKKTGFPSIQVPLGQFVKKGKTMPKTKNLPEDTSPAGQMLAGMSAEEIAESVEDLYSVLSPEKIEFLKQRGRKKKAAETVVEETKDGGEETTVPVPSAEPEGTTPEQELAEKERLAKVLSSIQSYQEMDEAIAKEDLTNLTMEDSKPQVGSREEEFHIACDLLRSTVRRQNLWASRCVHLYLQSELVQRERQSTPRTDSERYPLLLPVSLRCLLDVSASESSASIMLQTYVLQALYSLLQLYAHSDHPIRDITGQEVTAATLYHEYFLDDAVPTPPLDCYGTATVRPLSVDGNNSNGATVAYATSSSTTSAQQDGEAFRRDPLWTLLSKMRILPRLAQLVAPSSPTHLTPEALVAICGILALLAQRSPGVTSAIVQHKTLLRDLGQQSRDNTVALPMLILQCVLTRQSRTAAESLEFSTNVLVEDGLAATGSNRDIDVQRWSLVLWRSRLRYALSLEDVSILLTLAARHLALGPVDSELGPEFFSTFAVVLHSIRAARSIKGEKNNDAVGPDVRGVLSQAGVWLSSCKRQAFVHLNALLSGDTHIFPGDSDSLQVPRHLKFYTSVFRFLEAWLRMDFFAREEEAAENTGDFKAEETTDKEEEHCLDVILLCLRDPKLQDVITMALGSCFQTDFAFLGDKSDDELALEASSCAFVDSLLELATCISTAHSSGVGSRSTTVASNLTAVNKILVDLSVCFSKLDLMKSSVAITDRCRRIWFNRTHSNLVRFLFTTNASERIEHTYILAAVIGRLDRGEESTATVLFSCDRLFCSLTRNVAGSMNSSSPISSFFVRELCLTPLARAQLDHSFKLRTGLGISSDRLGPFELESLRSEADTPPGANEELLLPLGSLWLWKVFSGSVVDPKNNAEAVGVLKNTLELVYELETKNGSSALGYTDRLNIGGRLYYLMNLALQPEDIISNEKMVSPLNLLIDSYTRQVKDSKTVTAGGFSKECELHSSTKAKAKRADADEEKKQTETEKEFSKILWPKKQTQAVTGFLGDMCDSFLEYGAQYPFFTKCIRLFLASSFPPEVRCDLLQRLRGALHLLTLEDDDLTLVLAACLPGGLPSVDNSTRDPPSILDAATVVLVDNNVRSGKSFVSSWAVALLARSLAVCLEEGQGLGTTERRLRRLDPVLASRVLTVTECFLSSDRSLDGLVASSLRDPQASRTELLTIENQWGQIVEILQAEM